MLSDHSDPSTPSETAELLAGCHRGDADAFARLVERDLPWVRQHVRRRLGGVLRRRADSQDMIQDMLVQVLRSGPRFVVGDRRAFRVLMAKLVENTIRRSWRREAADRRDLRCDEHLPSDVSVAHLGGSVTRPSEVASTNELQAWVRLALELLDPDDRTLIVLREYRDQSFGAIAEALGTTEDAARMRFNRAVQRLARCMDRLRGREVGPP